MTNIRIFTYFVNFFQKFWILAKYNFCLFLQFLRQCDNIIFLKLGTISESGTYQQLIESKSEFENLVRQFAHN